MEAKPLKELREEKGFSKLALARMVGASPNTVDYLERGERPARGDTMVRLASALDVEVLAVREFAETLQVEPRSESPAFDQKSLYQLYEGSEEVRRTIDSRWGNRTVSGAEVA